MKGREGNEERREHSRYPVRLIVHFSKGDKRYRLVSENLSLGGIFLKGADAACEQGDEIALDILVATAAGGEETAKVKGVVVQRLPGAGVGVRFAWEGGDDDRPRLEAYIRRAGMLDDELIHEEHLGLATDAVEDP